MLNLLSVGAAYGLLVLVFQNEWPRSLLGFEWNGAIAAWLPLFLFVILFGLSMDYHVFILTRVREAFDRGMSDGGRGRARDQEHGRRGHERSDRDGRRVLDVRAQLELQMKQMGIGLAVAVLIDATIIRAVLLPATMKLLGDWNWWLPRKASAGSPGQARAGGEPAAA